jgi:hypothetical protein
MSQENVAAMRRWLEALSSEDFDAALALVHPESWSRQAVKRRTGAPKACAAGWIQTRSERRW